MCNFFSVCCRLQNKICKIFLLNQQGDAPKTSLAVLVWCWWPQSLLWSWSSDRDMSAMSQQRKKQQGAGSRQGWAGITHPDTSPALPGISPPHLETAKLVQQTFLWWKFQSKSFSIPCSPPVMWLCSLSTQKGKVPALEELSPPSQPNSSWIY